MQSDGKCKYADIISQSIKLYGNNNDSYHEYNDYLINVKDGIVYHL